MKTSIHIIERHGVYRDTYGDYTRLIVEISKGSRPGRRGFVDMAGHALPISRVLAEAQRMRGLMDG